MQTPKIALVTGGSRGLGKNTALALAAKGIDVVLTYHTRKEDADDTVQAIIAQGGKAVALQLDSSNTAGFEVFAAQLAATLQATWHRDTFDFLVNNAGTGVHQPFASTSEAEFDSLMNIHFKGVFFLTQRLLPLIADQGSIINLSTGLARFSTPGYSAYAAMKGAIETLTRYQAKELGSRGIRVNVVAPGAIETDFTKPAMTHNPGMKDFIGSQTALGRMGQPDDIGGLIAALCTPELSWVNAQRIEASGGMFL